jgi:hypothetical protein
MIQNVECGCFTKLDPKQDPRHVPYRMAQPNGRDVFRLEVKGSPDMVGSYITLVMFFVLIRKLVEFLVVDSLNFFLANFTTKTFFLSFWISDCFLVKFLANFLKFLEQALELS